MLLELQGAIGILEAQDFGGSRWHKAAAVLAGPKGKSQLGGKVARQPFAAVAYFGAQAWGPLAEEAGSGCEAFRFVR